MISSSLIFESRRHSERDMNFIPCDRKTPLLLPLRLNEWLPHGQQAGFVFEILSLRA